MLKKIFYFFIFFSAISSTSAAKNPADDPNLVLFYQHQGLQNFLLKNSIIIENLDPFKVISFNFISFDSIQPSNSNWNNLQSMKFAFDLDNKNVYFVADDGSLTFLNPNGTIAQGCGYAYGAEIVFFLATRHKFYASFDDNFYISLALKAGSPPFLDKDKNYILFADLGIHGAALYLDRNSIKIIQQDSSGCIISIDEVQVPDANFGNTQIANRFTHIYSYVYDKNVVMRFLVQEDKWFKIDPSITNPDDPNFSFDATIAEFAYFLSFGKKFYSTFNDDFYQIFYDI